MKVNRQNLISEIIASQTIRTQEELADALKARGINVTQATISRDIKEMHLVKGLSDDGTYRYVLGEQEEAGISDRLIRMLSDSVVSMDNASNYFTNFWSRMWSGRQRSKRFTFCSTGMGKRPCRALGVAMNSVTGDVEPTT